MYMPLPTVDEPTTALVIIDRGEIVDEVCKGELTVGDLTTKLIDLQSEHVHVAG